MKPQDKARFRANITWFNQFFDGISQLYEVLFNMLPAPFFPKDITLSSNNYYFSRFKTAPSIPPYYAFMLEGFKCALQTLAVIDTSLFAQSGPFMVEPSLIVVVHTQAEKYGWVGEFALKVIKNQDAELLETMKGIYWGKIKGKYQADYFAFQIQYDKFSDTNLQASVQQYVVDPIAVNMQRGFQSS